MGIQGHHGGRNPALLRRQRLCPRQKVGLPQSRGRRRSRLPAHGTPDPVTDESTTDDPTTGEGRSPEPDISKQRRRNGSPSGFEIAQEESKEEEKIEEIQ